MNKRTNTIALYSYYITITNIVKMPTVRVLSITQRSHGDYQSDGLKYLRATINTLLFNVGNDCIQNGQDFVASVTLSKQGENYSLGHNEEEKSKEL